MRGLREVEEETRSGRGEGVTDSCGRNNLCLVGGVILDFLMVSIIASELRST